LTPRAIDMVKAAMEREGASGCALRVGVSGGGCKGFEYHLGFEEHAGADDTVLEVAGLRVLVNADSQPYLSGATIDYVSTLNGEGFKFLTPNAKGGCGCGSTCSD